MRAELAAWVTGESSPNHTASRFGVHGTDLGIPWRAGNDVLLAFGDTYGEGWGGFGAGPSSADWRQNCLARCTVSDPSGGLVIESMVEDRPGHAGQILPSSWSPLEHTLIPTAGIEFGGRQWLHAMSVRRWGRPGRWWTNHAALWCSPDGDRWRPSAVRWPNRQWWRPWRTDGSRFQQAAFVRDGTHVLMFGTPAGRQGDAFLARSLDMREWRYWTGNGWGTGPATAAPVMEGPVSELSVIYRPASARWLALTLDGPRRAIVLRAAPSPTGPWTVGEPVLTSHELPGLYGGYWWPTGDDLHFLASSWPVYQVALFRLLGVDLAECVQAG